MPDAGKRFIEESFPVKEVSAESAREKNIRHGHISTLHIWWARRPLASSRATSYAALIPAPKDIDEWNKKRQFIIEFSKWENSLNPSLIEKARKDILEANGGVPPKVLDPFAGGGAIPLEALRLGCEVYSSDLNPVSVLIQKCTLEYPQKYGKPGEVEKEVIENGKYVRKKVRVDNKLLEDVKRWGNRVLEEAKKDIGQFYPKDSDGSVPVGYIWARTIPCQNPSCGAEIPLMRQFWLAKKNTKKVSLYPLIKNGQVEFSIVGTGYSPMPDDFEPDKGTVARANATCRVCGSMVDAKTTRRLFKEGKAGQRMVAVVLHKPGTQGKKYRLPLPSDFEWYHNAEEHLNDVRARLMDEWGIDPVPDEPIPPKNSHRAVGSQLPLYNFQNWGDLFNSRQKLSLITFVEKIRKAHEMMIEEGYEEEYAKAVISCINCIFSRLIDQSTVLVPWITQLEAVAHTFNRQALGMVWDYIESNPFIYFLSASGWVERVLNHCSNTSNIASCITQKSSTSLEYKDNFFDAVLTDPPYYDNVPYSYLSDFFYVWLKRTIGNLYPDLFSTNLTPKKQEIVVYDNMPGGKIEAKENFENMLKKSFQEIYRVLKPNGISIIVYAHKSTAGWETIINSLLDSGLIVTGSWPINTEMKSRLNANETASLASSIYIVARKMERQSTGFYNEVKDELKKHLNEKLDRLWDEGISGADFFISAIGSSIEVFGKYEKVIDYEGTTIRADRILQDVREIATDYAVRKILHNGFSGVISELTRFYVLWRWNYGEAKVPFDDARKLAMSCHIDLALEWNRHGFIRKEKEFIRVLGPKERDSVDLEDSYELITVMHRVLLLWEKGKRNEMLTVLGESGFGKSDEFYRVAQAVSETLPNDSKEKKLLEGFLSGRERIVQEIKEGTIQGELEL